MNIRYEILLTMYQARVTMPDNLVEAALDHGRELTLSDEQIYEQLELLNDDSLIERPDPQRSASGRITYYWVDRLTAKGIGVIDAYLRTQKNGQ